MIYLRSNIKTDTKNHRKSRFNLTTGQFLFSKYKTVKGLHWIACVGSLTKEAWFSKILSKIDIFFISFQQLDLIDMTFQIWDLILEQERLLNNKNIDRICKILDKNDVNTSRHSLKSWPSGGNTVDPEKENKQYSDQLGGNERWLKDKSVSWGQWCSKNDM